MDVTLSNTAAFPPGTSVAAYPISNWPGSRVDPTAAPLGSATNTQTMGTNNLTFTGLTDGQEYVAVGTVNGTRRYVSFAALSVDLPPQNASEAAARNTAIATHAAQATGVHGITAAGAALVDDASAAAQRTTLGLGTAATQDIDTILPWHHNVAAWADVPDLNTGFTNPLEGAYAYGATRYNLAQNDEVAWDLVLAAGTWDISLVHWKNVDEGIGTVSIDGTTIGTVDCYAASLTTSIVDTISGVAIASTGKKRIKVKAATKNASSSGYLIGLQGITLRRTA